MRSSLHGGFFCMVLSAAVFLAISGDSQTISADSSRRIDQRVEDLLKRMTLEEKVYQLQSQLLMPEKYKERNFAVGHVRDIVDFMHKNGALTAGTCATAINEDTRQSILASRLGIPVLQQGEALHGANWGMATVFPQCIGLAATFDDSLVFHAGEVVARELRAVGVREVYAPVINIARDPRWGRLQETYGEDVYLTSRMGVAYTKALQQGGIIATLKHLVDNYGTGGHDSYASDDSWRTLREVYLEPFRVCVIEGGAGGIMAAYNSVDGVPCSNNKVLLEDIVRKEWGFKGLIVSDYSGVNGVYRAHHVTGSLPEAEAVCLQAGLDVMLPNGYRDLLALVKNGSVSEKDIDRSVRRVLAAKFRLGLFEQPYVDTAMANRIVRCTAHRELAYKAACETMTLLKNDHQTLPLAEKTVKRIAVFGPAANILCLGDYSGPAAGWKGDGAVTPYQALVRRLAGKVEVILYQEGMDRVALAKSCDAAIYFATIQEGEAHDRSLLTLPEVDTVRGASGYRGQIVDDASGAAIREDQEKAIQAIAATGVKTIVVLENGSPIDMHRWIGKVDAVLEAWYPGEQGGTAIAQTLFGDIDPGGRLPITWPKHTGQIPIYYAVKPSGRGYDYLDDDGKPMFPFGYGLSYTTFIYSHLVIPATLHTGDSLRVKVTVTNTGDRAGDAVIQLYLHDSVAPVVRPLRELKAFKRVTLAAGESREVTLTVPYRSFGYWDESLKFVVTPGIFDVMISSDAEHDLLKGQIRIE